MTLIESINFQILEEAKPFQIYYNRWRPLASGDNKSVARLGRAPVRIRKSKSPT